MGQFLCLTFLCLTKKHRTAATRCDFGYVAQIGCWIRSQSLLTMAVGDFARQAIMTTPKDLAGQMAQKTDDELLAMFGSAHDWTAEALAAAKSELQGRNVDMRLLERAPLERRELAIAQLEEKAAMKENLLRVLIGLCRGLVAWLGASFAFVTGFYLCATLLSAIFPSKGFGGDAGALKILGLIPYLQFTGVAYLLLSVWCIVVTWPREDFSKRFKRVAVVFLCSGSAFGVGGVVWVHLL